MSSARFNFDDEDTIPYYPKLHKKPVGCLVIPNVDLVAGISIWATPRIAFTGRYFYGLTQTVKKDHIYRSYSYDGVIKAKNHFNVIQAGLEFKF